MYLDLRQCVCRGYEFTHLPKKLIDFVIDDVGYFPSIVTHLLFDPHDLIQFGDLSHILLR